MTDDAEPARVVRKLFDEASAARAKLSLFHVIMAICENGDLTGDAAEGASKIGRIARSEADKQLRKYERCTSRIIGGAR